MTISIINIPQYFSDVSLVSGESFGIFTYKRWWDSQISAMNNTETPGIATIKDKRTIDTLIIKYQGWDERILKNCIIDQNVP